MGDTMDRVNGLTQQNGFLRGEAGYS
jgi:hypothetical protein